MVTVFIGEYAAFKFDENLAVDVIEITASHPSIQTQFFFLFYATPFNLRYNEYFSKQLLNWIFLIHTISLHNFLVFDKEKHEKNIQNKIYFSVWFKNNASISYA